MGLKEAHEAATSQNAASQNAAYDAFVDTLDFSSGKYETKVVSPSPVQKPLTGMRHLGDVWRAKLFSKDVLEKYGPGKHTVTISEGTAVLCTFTVEG